LKTGDKVTWTSQAMGCEKNKNRCNYYGYPGKGHKAKQHIPKTAKKSHIKFDTDCSTYDRILIAVPAGKDGKITHYYCPRKSVLVAQGNEEALENEHIV